MLTISLGHNWLARI